MKKRHLIPLALLLLLAIATPRGVDAQVLYGSLTGNVTDQTGAVVNGAKAEARNIATGVSTIISADQRGSYLFSNLQVGVYKVTITAQGFKALTQDRLNHEAITFIDRSRLSAFCAGGRRAVRPTAAETVNARTTGATRSHQAGSPAHAGSFEDHFTATGRQSQ